MLGIDKPTEAPKDATQQMGEFMPDASQLNKKSGPEVEYQAEPFTEKDLDAKIGKPRKEILGSEKRDYADIMKQAKETIKENSQDKKVSHGDTQSFDIDEIQFIYLRDDSQAIPANRDRLFKKVA